MKNNGFFKNKSFKYGSYAFVMTAVVIAVIVLVNAILGLSVVRDRVRFDITKTKLFSIGQQSIDVVKALNKDVDIYIMAPENQYGNILVTEVLKQYAINGNGRIKSPQYIDLDKDPTFISKNLDPDQVKGIQTGDIVVKSGSNIKVLTDSDFTETSYDSYGTPQVTGIKVEQAFTSAIKSVTADKSTTIGFVSGHGEIGASAISQLRSAISMNNYKMQDVSLSSPISSDVNDLIFTAPTGDLLPKELENLISYLDKGGNAIFLFDVPQVAKEMTNFNQVFNKYYLQINTDLVVEYSQQNYLQDNWRIRPRVYQNDVTQNLNADQLFVYLPGSRSVTIMGENQGLVISPLFGTTENAGSVDLSTNQEKQGQYYIGALSTSGVAYGVDSKIAVIGNCSFVTDIMMAQYGDNGLRYIVSILNWMQNSADSVIIPAKSLEQPPLNLTEQSRIFVFILLIAILPLIIIGFGVFVWIRRKNL